MPVFIEVVWRNAADFLRNVVFIKLEHVGVFPDISAVKSDVDGDITDDSYVVLLCIRSQIIPLSEEKELQESIEGNIFGERLFIAS